MASNVEKLQNAGVLHEDLSRDFNPVFEDLSDDEVNLILSVKERMDGVEQGKDQPRGTWAAFVAF
jgi:hypothetical protein